MLNSFANTTATDSENLTRYVSTTNLTSYFAQYFQYLKPEPTLSASLHLLRRNWVTFAF